MYRVSRPELSQLPSEVGTLQVAEMPDHAGRNSGVCKEA